MTQAPHGAMISLYRLPQLLNIARRFKIYVDGVKVGAIGDGKTLHFPVPAGAHRVRAKLDWCSSPELVVELGPGEQAYLTVATAGSYYTMLANQIFRPGKYLALDRVYASR
jgi:hypothetical protein